MKILIVEDNEDSRVLQETTLEAQGHTVEVAVNGKQALEMAMRSRPDLIISDILMPEMDGFALCQAVKEDEQLKTVPFIFYTASYITPEDEELAKTLGGTRFIVKTGDTEEFLKTIEDIIKEYRESGLKTPGKSAVGGEELEHMHKKALVRQLDKKVRELEKEHEALKESEKKFRCISSTAQEAIIMADDEGRVLYWNEAAETMFGYTKDEAFVRKLHELIIPPRFHKDHLKGMKTFQESGNGNLIGKKAIELTALRKDGTEFPVEISLSGTRLENRWVAVGMIRDISERKQAMEKLRKALGGTIRALAAAVETRDPYTAGHQQRVTDLARAIATEMGCSTECIEGIRMAGIIHDVGKIGVPAEILTKPGRITATEFEIIKTHSQVGYDILKDIEFPWPVADIVLQHQERMDGSGYPRGLSGDDILMEARIIAVADTVEAMASHRPYRAALGIDKALEEITKNRGTRYDADVVDACVRLFREKGFEFK
ncbi:MAG: HD domain-containing phosphohydrolase [Candidatus Brocadiales bacterium]